jgi:ribosomal-protein-alanine N-acetyltransferase
MESDPWKRLGYGLEDWKSVLATPLQGREAFIIEVDGRAEGIAVLRPKFLFGEYLELLAIAPSARGRGYGRTLLAYVEGLVFKRTNNLFVCVSDFNERARTFYNKNGYAEIGPIPGLLTPAAAEILMRKTIGPARLSRSHAARPE